VEIAQAARELALTHPSGRSVIATDDNIMAVLNLVDGIDWYSLSNLAFLSTTKLPTGAVFYPSTTLAYSEDSASVVFGGADGGAHILSRNKWVTSLQHGGTSLILRWGRSDEDRV